jgi:hypothetical protein
MKRTEAMPQMGFEVRDIETGNCVGRFDDEAAARVCVQKLIEHFDAEYGNSLARPRRSACR